MGKRMYVEMLHISRSVELLRCMDLIQLGFAFAMFAMQNKCINLLNLNLNS